MRAALFLFGVVSYAALFTALLYAAAVGVGVLTPAHALPAAQTAATGLALFAMVVAFCSSIAHPALRAWSVRLVPVAIALMLMVWLSQPGYAAMFSTSGLA